MTDPTLRATHVWQEAGMGTAPYSYHGEVHDAGRAICQCQACGTPIRFLFTVYDSTGTAFIVGSECIRKTGDTRMTSDAIEARRKLDKAKRDAAQAAKRQAAEAKRQEALQAQREKNGGLTDHELAMQQWEAKQADQRAAAAKANEWILQRLSHITWDGLRDLEGTSIIDKSPRFQLVVKNMWAKTFGRGGSKAYRAAEADFEQRVDAMHAAR